MEKAIRSDKGGEHSKAKKGDKRIGNNFVQYRKWFGKKKLIETPEIFEAEFEEFIEWCEEHPIMKPEIMRSGEKQGQVVNVPMPRIADMKGFAVFLGINYRTIMNYGMAEEYKEFHDAYRRASDYMDNEKLVNGLVGTSDPRVTAQILGLRDKQEMTIIPTLHFDKDDEGV